jgi:signal transduction histidine kinase
MNRFDAQSYQSLALVGVAGMYERAESIGGHLEVTSNLGAGTSVIIVVPIAEKILKPTKRSIR